MSYKTSVVLYVCVLTLTVLSCEKDSGDPHPVNKEKLIGHVQKGPFLNGTALMIIELNGTLGQTGKIFSTQIKDNRGSFEFGQVELASQFVELKADGFYYNEVRNDNSNARLILYALSNLDDKETVNVNMLSHLEKDRIMYLVDKGESFNEAKQQAQQDVLGIFSLDRTGISESELLDIEGSEEEDAILLAVSLILQGHRSVAELSELLANINNDIREDGILDDPATGSALVNQAMWLDLEEIRENLESWYGSTGEAVELAGFEGYIQQFLELTEYEYTDSIDYPEFSEYGENILYGDKNDFMTNDHYSMSAKIPLGHSLTVRLSGGIWWYRAMPDGPVNWKVSSYDHNTLSQTFTIQEPGVYSDISIEFAIAIDSVPTTHILLEYFENDMDVPARTKTLNISSREISR